MIPAGVQVFGTLEPVDMRYSFDRLSGLVKEQIGYEARSGALFVFFGKRRDAIKVLFFDGSGLCVFYNNASERAPRSIATGRRAWLFIGSDDHVHAAANVFSLIASCRLHDLDPEPYLSDIFRVLPYWPRDRYLELAPKYWRATRARLLESELALPIGHISVPAPPAAEEKSIAS